LYEEGEERKADLLFPIAQRTSREFPEENRKAGNNEIENGCGGEKDEQQDCRSIKLEVRACCSSVGFTTRCSTPIFLD
jgi:hypothetical protein